MNAQILNAWMQRKLQIVHAHCTHTQLHGYVMNASTVWTKESIWMGSDLCGKLLLPERHILDACEMNKQKSVKMSKQKLWAYIEYIQSRYRFLSKPIVPFMVLLLIFQVLEWTKEQKIGKKNMKMFIWIEQWIRQKKSEG